MPRPRKHRLVKTSITITIILIGLVRAGPGWAEPDSTAADEVENPLQPLLKKLGTDWGFDLSAERIALNPFKGAVVLRDVKASTKLQGPFLSVKRISAKIDFKTSSISRATLEQARLSVDMSKGLGIKKLSGDKLFGRLNESVLQGATISVKSGGIEVFQLLGLMAKSKGLSLGSESGRLGVRGSIVISGGQASFLGGLTRLTKLSITGSFEGRRLKIKSLTGAVGIQGSVSCGGTIALDAPKKGKTSELVCRIERFPIKREDLIDVLVTGEVRLSKQPQSYRISGAVDAVEGTRLDAGRWGARKVSGDDSVSLEMTIRIKGAKGRATVRVSGAPSSGRVSLVGDKGRRGTRLAEDLLKSLGAGTKTNP